MPALILFSMEPQHSSAQWAVPSSRKRPAGRVVPNPDGVFYAIRAASLGRPPKAMPRNPAMGAPMARKKVTQKSAQKRAPKMEPADLFASNDPVAAIAAQLRTLEGQAARGDLVPSGLEAFKSALDELRLRAWGLLAATNADDPRGFQERFRIRRGQDMCRALCRDLHEGRLHGQHPDLPELSAAAHDLAVAVDDARSRTT